MAQTETDDTAVPLPESVVEGYEPAAVAARIESANRREVQNINEWMARRYGGYRLLSPSRDGEKGGVRTTVVNPAHQLNAWGISHYRYPLFAYEETVPWTRLRDGMGMNENSPPHLRATVLKTLKAMGVTKARTDVGWGNMRFDAPGALKQQVQDDLKARVLAWKAAGMRPLICLDTHPAAPCPINEATVTLAAPLNEGDTTALIITRNAGEVPVPYKSGFSHVRDYWAAQWLVTAVEKLNHENTYRVTFAKPWPANKVAIAGAELPFAYLAYRPFSDDGSELSKETYAGFQSYVRAVVKFLDTLGLRKSKTDPGFDIEICNEMSNWAFRGLMWYTGRDADGEGNIDRIYRESIATIRANPAFKHVRIVNGFHNQGAGGAQSTEPAGGSSISAHPYRGAVPPNATGEDAFGRSANPDGSPLPFFTPPMTVHAPETIFSAEVLENIVANISPLKVQMWGNARGRGLQPRVNGADINSPIARETDGSPARPVEFDMTEWSDAPGYDLPLSEQERLLAKYCLRGHIVGIGKGVSRIYWFAAMGPGHGFLSLRSDSLPPKEAAPVTLFKRLMAATRGKRITTPRHVSVVSISETHGQVQFRGNGTPEFPDLPNRDILIPQAFQLSDASFGVFVWVPNKDYKKELPAADYTIRWSGVKPTAVSKFRYRDLLKTRSVVVTPTATGADWVEFTLPVTDTPRLLVMEGV